MRVTRTVSITALADISVQVNITPYQGYVSSIFTANIVFNTIVGPGPYDVTVNWGDGTIETWSSPTPTPSYSHRYGATGSYTVTVNVYDPDTMATGSGSAPVQVSADLTASLSADPISGDIPLTVNFTFTFSGGYSPVSYTLNFGDGSTPASGSTPGTASHTYTVGGTFIATLTVTDGLGLAVTSTVRIGLIPITTIVAALAIGAGILALIVWKG